MFYRLASIITPNRIPFRPPITLLSIYLLSPPTLLVGRARPPGGQTKIRTLGPPGDLLETTKGHDQITRAACPKCFPQVIYGGMSENVETELLSQHASPIQLDSDVLSTSTAGIPGFRCHNVAQVLEIYDE